VVVMMFPFSGVWRRVTNMRTDVAILRSHLVLSRMIFDLEDRCDTFLRNFCSHRIIILILNMDVIRRSERSVHIRTMIFDPSMHSSETSAHIRTKRRYIPQDGNNDYLQYTQTLQECIAYTKCDLDALQPLLSNGPVCVSSSDVTGT
jgi:hypothetical protein